MSSHEHILSIMRDAERILAPLRDFDRLYGRGVQQIVQDHTRREQMFRAALPGVSHSFRTAIESLQPAFDRLSEFERHSAAMASLADAHRNLSALVVKQADLERIARASVVLSSHWRENIAVYQRLGAEAAAAAELALKSHYAAVAESAVLAHERLLRLPWDSLGRATMLADTEFLVLRSKFTGLTEAYRSLMRSFEEREHFMASFPPIISAEPPLEILRSTSVLESLSEVTRSPESAEIDDFVESDLEGEGDSSIDTLLAALNPALPSVWLGAREALHSDNPDRGRHVVVSLRELLTRVLHALAPTAKVQDWTSDPSHYHEGRLTREARVLFACRDVNHGPFSKFVSADVRATIELISLFLRGTHEIAVSFSEAQLRALVVRTESLLRFLILVARIAQ